MNTIKYRQGNPSDLEAIAQLHAQSWSDNYRDTFSDAYLDGPVFEERLKVWRERFAEPTTLQHIILAFDKNQLCGFICIYLEKHETYGALIDNLHVLNTYKGRGIGKMLMIKAKEYIYHFKNPGYYLYVIKSNKGAIAFYKRMNGFLDGTEIFNNPGGGTSVVYRFVWKNERWHK